MSAKNFPGRQGRSPTPIRRSKSLAKACKSGSHKPVGHDDEDQAREAVGGERGALRGPSATVPRGQLGPGSPIPPFRDPLSNGNIRTFESRAAWQTLGRLALNFHRTKEWTFAAIGASLSPCRDKGRLTHPGSC